MGLKKIGPGLLVSAAFVGPGTLITCSIAGSSYGYTLIWAIIFSLVSTIILQEMTGRLGITLGSGLSDAIRQTIKNIYLRRVLSILVILAIALGNAAYQSGNISGAVMGMAGLTGDGASSMFKLLSEITISGIAFGLLLVGKYKILERVLIGLVGFMSLAFLMAVFTLPIDFDLLIKGLFVPKIPDGSLMIIVALIGTTVVPYNLFLHSASAATKWKDVQDIKSMRLDTVISIAIGGFVSVIIIVTSASTLYVSGIEVKGISELAGQLEPLLGKFAVVLFSLGLVSAGLTSAITAPLAAAYAVSGIFGQSGNMKSNIFRGSWMFVLFTGLIVAAFGVKPIFLIQSAQFANGLLLPFVGFFLLILMNNQKMGKLKNGAISNSLSLVVLIIITGLGIRSILTALNFL